MATSSLSPDEFNALLQSELAKCNPRAQAFLGSRLIEPYQHTLPWEYGNDEPCEAWVFADMGERDVVAVYCRGGFGVLGSPWGINFRKAENFGMDSGWYRSLGKMLEEWIIE